MDSRYIMGTNEFTDMPHIMQIFSEEVTSQFMNLESIEGDQSELRANEDYFFKGRIIIGESKQIHIRRVIGFM